MAFRTVNSLDADTTVSLGGVNRKTNKANPKSVEGYFLGSKEVADAKKKSGTSYIHIFQTPKGNLGVWGKTDMDNKLKSVTPGTMTKITHASMRKTPNGDMYVYEVAVDDDNTITVDALTAGAGNSGLDNDATGYEDETGGVGEEETAEVDEDVAQQLALEAAARKARVQALVGGKKKTV